MSQATSITIPKRRVSKITAPGVKTQYQVLEETGAGIWSAVGKPRPHSTTAFADLGRLTQKELTRHRLTVYRADGEVHVFEQREKPDLKKLQSLVGGNIELVPHDYRDSVWFKKAHQGEILAVYCDEEARLKAEQKVNPFFASGRQVELLGNVLVEEIVRS